MNRFRWIMATTLVILLGILSCAQNKETVKATSLDLSPTVTATLTIMETPVSTTIAEVAATPTLVPPVSTRRKGHDRQSRAKALASIPAQGTTTQPKSEKAKNLAPQSEPFVFVPTAVPTTTGTSQNDKTAGAYGVPTEVGAFWTPTPIAVVGMASPAASQPAKKKAGLWWVLLIILLAILILAYLILRRRQNIHDHEAEANAKAGIEQPSPNHDNTSETFAADEKNIVRPDLEEQEIPKEQGRSEKLPMPQPMPPHPVEPEAPAVQEKTPESVQAAPSLKETPIGVSEIPKARIRRADKKAVKKPAAPSETQTAAAVTISEAARVKPKKKTVKKTTKKTVKKTTKKKVGRPTKQKDEEKTPAKKQVAKKTTKKTARPATKKTVKKSAVSGTRPKVAKKNGKKVIRKKAASKEASNIIPFERRKSGT